MKEIALQAYSLKDYCTGDLENTIKRLSDIGYNGVELFSFYEFKYTKEELKNIFNKYNMKLTSTHMNLDILKEHFDQMVEYAKFMNVKYIAIPFMEASTAAEWIDFATEMNELGKKLLSHGISLLYHNHSHEFVKTDNGKMPIEIIMEFTDSKFVNLEIDCYWVVNAKFNLLEFLTKYASRIKLVHIKDMKDNEMTEVGTGEIDYKSILPFISKNDINWLVIEQDEIKIDKYTSVAISYNNLKSLIS